MEKLKALLIGAGGWGRTWGRNVASSKDVELAGWIDLKDGAAAEAARQLGLKDVHTGTDMMAGIRAVRPDFLINLTVPPAHHTVTIQALEAGLPVICEKPMADSMAHAREMVEASERTGKLLVISQQRRYNNDLAAMRRLIADRIGPLAILNADFYIGHREAGFHVGMESPLLLDMAIHTFDVARYLSSADPVAVYCEHFDTPWSWYHGKASAIAIFEMTGALHYTYRGSWSSQGHDTEWEADWRAVGPNGTVLWDGKSVPVAELVTAPGDFSGVAVVEGEPDEREPEGLAGVLADFVRALRIGSTPMGECHDNIKSLAMVFGAIESAKSGKRVAIEA